MAPSKRVREPIQVYLTPAERGRLDRLAKELGVSRAEVLRRGIVALSGGAGDTDPLDDLIGTLDDPALPPDLAERHDDYLADPLEGEWRRPGRRRRSS